MKCLNNEKGQTMTEYILLILVVTVIAISVFKKLDEYLITNPDSFLSTYLLSYKSTLEGANANFEGRYLRFKVRR